MNKTKLFFDEKANTWDAHETKSQEFFDNFVKTYMPLKKGMRVIDLGCGTGVITNSIYKVTQSDVLGIDLSDNMILKAQEKFDNPYIMFVTEDFYLSNHQGYDAIICHNAYPHFTDRKGFKDKAYETLANDGLLIIAHSSSKEFINAIHKKPGVINSKALIAADKEAEFYQDKFEIIKTIDKDIYLIVLKKK